ncbi:nucleotidyl transferase AbiEii/AbiGii toxin family protein [uncultured Bacteroides sp.]|uniref:nucleotidyl transferase AbiEii/AbiGii toxin family protein n=1 Tax=uncultured Bacteroides sp. TaxID=162156 RepID=UPI002AAC359C|nr:nucleotidyl transferase AbiEii/AbiGii toxin family protein [uncultured Bacteroides sp.]
MLNTRLVGGTALALQIGHRKSVDLDLFGIVTAESNILVEELKSLGNLTILKDSKNIHIYLINNVKVDIVNYSYKWIEEAIVIDNVRMAGLKDISAMKLAAVTGRGSKKDFIDIYFLSHKYSLKKMLSYYSIKYPEGSEFIVLKSLSYLDDAEEDPSPFMLEKITWDEIKKMLCNLLK